MQGMEEPLIAIENLCLSNKDIQLIGNDKTTVKFTINGITYIKFKDGNLGEELLSHSTMNLTVLGRANINEWMGNCTPQIIIENCEIKDTTYDF